jgi:hypothetical protein
VVESLLRNYSWLLLLLLLLLPLLVLAKLTGLPEVTRTTYSKSKSNIQKTFNKTFCQPLSKAAAAARALAKSGNEYEPIIMVPLFGSAKGLGEIFHDFLPSFLLSHDEAAKKDLDHDLYVSRGHLYFLEKCRVVYARNLTRSKRNILH